MPTDAETLPARANFAVLRARVVSLDHLHLHHAGHRRSLFTWDATGHLTATWLQP